MSGSRIPDRCQICDRAWWGDGMPCGHPSRAWVHAFTHAPPRETWRMPQPGEVFREEEDVNIDKQSPIQILCARFEDMALDVSDEAYADALRLSQDAISEYTRLLNPEEPLSLATADAFAQAAEALERIGHNLANALYGTPGVLSSTEQLATQAANELRFYRTRKSYAELAEHWDRLEDMKKAMK